MSTEKLMRRLTRGPLHITLVIIALIWITPTVGTLISSLRSPQDVRATGWWTVLQQPLNFTQYTLENYRYIMTREGLARSFLNSLIITIPSTLLPIFFASLAAYAFAWMRFPGRNLLLTLVIGLIVVPLQMTFIPLLRWIFEPLGLYGTFMGLWLAHTGYGLPFAIFLLRNFFGSLPKELIESAFIDGASWWTAFWRLVLPLSLPALASLAIFQFLWVWNDLLVALIYVGGKPDVAPITWQIANLAGSRGQDWHLLTAGAFVSIVLPVAVFLMLQRYFVRGILAGSIKG